MIIRLGTCMLLCVCHIAAAEDAGDKVQQLLKDARTARSAKDLPKAKELLDKARLSTDDLPDESRTIMKARITNEQGLIALDEKKVVEAITTFKESIALFEQAGENGQTDLSVVLYNTSFAFGQLKQFSEAADFLRRRIPLLEKLNAEATEKYENLDQLFGCLREINELSQADAVLQQMRTLQEHRFGTKSEAVAKLIDAMAVNARLAKQPEQEEQRWKEALAHRLELYHGRDHSTVIDSHFRLAGFYHTVERWDEAIREFQTADTKAKHCYGPDADQRLAVLVPLSQIAKSQQNAELERATTTELNRLTVIRDWYLKKPKPPEMPTAEQIAEHTQKLRARREEAVTEFGNPSQPWFDASLALMGWYAANQQHADAVAIANEVLSVSPPIFAVDHPEIAATHFLRAESLRALQRGEEAAADFQKADELNEQSGIAPTTTVMRTKLRIGQLAFEQKKYSTALPYYERYFQINQMEPQPETVEMGIAHNQLGVCQTHVQQFVAAKGNFQRAYSILSKHLPAAAPLIKTVSSNFDFVQGELQKRAAVANSAREQKPALPRPDQPSSVNSPPPNGVGSTSNSNNDTKNPFNSCFYLGFNFLLAIVVSRLAWQRGYNSLYWFIAFWCSCTTPIITPCVLAILPNRREQRRRLVLTDRLDHALQKVSPLVVTSVQAVTADSLGDQKTRE